MAIAGSKTPVSILNEYWIRKGNVPKFSIVESQLGTNKTLFKCLVSVENIKALGEGRSKQEAKHDAAKNMLDLLDISCNDEYQDDVKQIVIPHSDVSYNAVGELAEYCKIKHYPEPEYLLVNVYGPPHARVFTMKCNVSQISFLGESRTKKQAKHIAAQKMLIQLKEEAKESPMAVAVPKKISQELPSFPEVSKPVPGYQPKTYYYKDLCNAYLDIAENSETVANILKSDSLITIETAPKLLKKISEELGVHVKIEQFRKNEFSTELPETVLEDFSALDLMDKLSINENVTNPNENNQDSFLVTLQLMPEVVGLGVNVPEACVEVLNFLKILAT